MIGTGVIADTITAVVATAGRINFMVNVLSGCNSATLRAPGQNG
jgi:hypothetical protein